MNILSILLIILCILDYIVIGILAAMIEARREIKEYGELDSENHFYIAICFFWPIYLAFILIASPVFLLKHFIEWYAKKVKEGEE